MTDQMRDKDVISKGPKKRDAMCFELRHAILIPKGTILRQEHGKPGIFTAPVGHGSFALTTEAGISHPEDYGRVVA